MIDNQTRAEWEIEAIDQKIKELKRELTYCNSHVIEKEIEEEIDLLQSKRNIILNSI